MVDRDRVAGMLRNLERYVQALRELSAVPLDAFLADKHLMGSARYHFTIAIQCCLDVAAHIIASEGLRPPDSNADMLAILAEKGILTEETKESCRKMVQFRNLLVHVYTEVDDRIVYQFLQERLGDFAVFASAISKVR